MASQQYIQYSVIVPAFRENANIRPLVTRIFGALRRVDSPVQPEQVEVIVVDDNSRDGTLEAVESLKAEGYNVVLIVREDESGLSSAVLRGFSEARGSKFVVMDGAFTFFRCRVRGSDALGVQRT